MIHPGSIFAHATPWRLEEVAAPSRERSRLATVLLAVAALAPAVLIATSTGQGDSNPSYQAALVSLLAVLVVSATVATLFHVHRRPDARSALMGVSFVGMSVVLIARVVAMAPGELYSPGITRIAEMATLPLGALVLAFSVAPTIRRRHQVEIVVQSAPALAIFLVSVLVLVFSARSSIPVTPTPGGDTAIALFIATSVLLAILARRAGRTAGLSDRPGDILVTLGVIASICAYWGITNADRDMALWWTAHTLELVGVAAICLPATRDLWRVTASRPLVGDFSAKEIVADEEAFLDRRVHALMLQLARKDDVTHDHTRRVAMLAVNIGEHLGLDARSLRDLAAGGLLHDIGKLQTPDRILRKPGKLTDDEYEVIKRHPSDGRQMLGAVGRFNDRVLHLVEAHHERLDGAGYPYGAVGPEIAREARILAVADVYDALTSDRPYRMAWAPDRALGVIEAETGDAFDPEAVAALRAIVTPSKFVPKAIQAQANRARYRRAA
ncbi:MAG: HD-GYP domain-containing protein [Patulibacter sp.]